MNSNNDIAKLSKEYVKNIKKGLKTRKNKNKPVPSKSKILQNTFYHGYLEALKQNGLIDLNKNKIKE